MSKFASLGRFPIKLNRTRPLAPPEPSPFKGEGLCSGEGLCHHPHLYFHPHRWGRVGVGVVRAECIELGRKPL